MKQELENIKELNNFQLVEYFQNNLISRATGGDFDNELYQYVRKKLLQNKSLEDFLPKWIKINRTVEQFWLFIKNKFNSYEERRKFLWDEFASLLNYLETNSISPLEKNIVFDERHIHLQWEKALERKKQDPEGAITMARTLIESVLKYILDEKKITYNSNSDLSDLYKKVAKSLNLAPEQHQEQIFKQILGGVSGIISGLGTLRNKLGDAHGKSIKRVKPAERHSELAVNLAGTMAIFLFKTFKKKT